MEGNMKGSKIKSGNVSSSISGTGTNLVNELLKKVTPNAQKVIQAEFERIEQHARAQWLVRGAKKITPEQRKKRAFQALTKGKGYSPEKAEGIIASMANKGSFQNDKAVEISKGSKDKIYTGIRITENAQIRFVIGNSAPYAWAIRVGVDSETDMPMGTRISNELLWKPSKKATDIIAEAIAEDLLKSLK